MISFFKAVPLVLLLGATSICTRQDDSLLSQVYRAHTFMKKPSPLSLLERAQTITRDGIEAAEDLHDFATERAKQEEARESQIRDRSIFLYFGLERIRAKIKSQAIIVSQTASNLYDHEKNILEQLYQECKTQEAALSTWYGDIPPLEDKAEAAQKFKQARTAQRRQLHEEQVLNTVTTECVNRRLESNFFLGSQSQQEYLQKYLHEQPTYNPKWVAEQVSDTYPQCKNALAALAAHRDKK